MTTTTEKKPKAEKKAKPDVRFRKATVHDTMDVKELCRMFHKEYLDNLDLSMSDVIFKKVASSELMKTTWVAHLPDEIIPAEYEEDIDREGNKVRRLVKQQDLRHGKVVGVFSGYFTNYILDNSMMFHELLWYVHPDYRQIGKDLYDYAESLIRSKGAVSMVMTHMATDQSDRLETLYKRMGYKPLETHYIKRFEKE